MWPAPLQWGQTTDLRAPPPREACVADTSCAALLGGWTDGFARRDAELSWNCLELVEGDAPHGPLWGSQAQRH